MFIYSDLMLKLEMCISLLATNWKSSFLLMDSGVFGMKPNFESMSRAELKTYVLKNREDIEAIRALFHHPDGKWITMPPMFTSDGEPIEENIRIGEEALKKRIEQEKNK
jgi:hypothetical protein